ncbi:LacI family DNA-binding transcriptional regulator [Streptococcus loxodontisalivarius]|uniref:DNA-binding LacI/PurR family transcriptional regulator n=1 Tax=Streptococcus loxodontisalivarius TaxID=1349415 RepID=A0ABS2PQG6_9STRE|nr:LacI family DNA-binding transcriptional regulator [Streptococcus loxodontisalivarius]MBM7642283.1 DNA-binding LacI/PurR family transcriptional regulator [Streptococcus loxodontisalivarius]
MPTIKDVARLAGVSPSTASRAMHDNKMISEATKERVRKAMEELDYSPNYSAQNLVKRESNTIGIILPVRENQDSLGNNPFFMQIIQGITSVCTEKDYMVSLASGRSDEELIKNIQTLIRSGNIRKFIFLYSKKDDPAFSFVQKEQVPCVVVGQAYGPANQETMFVDNDNFQAGQDVTQFLLDRHYQNLLFLYTDLDEMVEMERIKGYLDRMQSLGLKALSFQLSRVDEAKTMAELQSFLQQNPQIEAMICCDDVIAVRTQRILEWLQYKPSDFAMISFNNTMVTELAKPSLTSVEIFPFQLGEKAASLLLERNLKGLDKPYFLPHEIIERGSTPYL